MKEIFCPICGEGQPCSVLYPQNFSLDDIDAKVFSARKMPDRRHYKIVKCDKCGAVYSSPILDDMEISRLYEESEFTYGEEASNIADVYQTGLEQALKSDFNGKRLLEIGCGNGFFLERAVDLGFDEVRGVEPSFEAVAAAPDRIRRYIHTGFFCPGIFAKDYFDVVCIFQTIEHVLDPNLLIQESFNVLRPGGTVLLITHNAGAVSAKLLGAKSPIIDVGHIFLFDPKTISALLAKHGAVDITTRNISNRYALSYWTWLMPVPKTLKKGLLSLLKVTGIGRLKVPLRAGNMAVTGVKPMTKKKGV